MLYTWNAVSKSLYKVVEDWSKRANVNGNHLKTSNRNRWINVNSFDRYITDNVDNNVLQTLDFAKCNDLKQGLSIYGRTSVNFQEV